MPPLILHNVPDEELYVGEDGVQRPYAMLFPGHETTIGSRSRKTLPETGSFGKSTRRSRSRTGTPAAARREDPTLAAADAIFSAYLQNRAATPSESPQRKNSLSASTSQPNLSQSGPLTQVDGNASGPTSRYVHKEPTEVILRGFKSTQQYAAIREYERIGGRICEDYPRDAPHEQRRYKADLRDPAALRQKAMTAAEKAKALRFAGGDHWIKVTFESNEGAEVAIEASPQTIHGYHVFAELYRGIPPSSDEATPASGFQHTPRGDRFRAPSTTSGTQAWNQNQPGLTSSSPESQASTRTLDTNTLSISNTTETASNATVTGFVGTQSSSQSKQELIYCAKIPTAKRMQLLPAEQALLPQKSYGQRIVSNLPIIGWFTSDIIGSAVPRTDSGDFDWAKASLYWKLMWWIDSWTGLFDITNNDKED